MKRKITLKQIILLTTLLLILALWLNNTSLLVDREGYRMQFLAHRGLAQTFELDNVTWETDTSKIIDPPEHMYLENTLDSMQVSFDYGADIVELDIRLTKDNQLAVFHDYELGYRTNLTGHVFDHTMQSLKGADIGYGYTADSGKTFPFRGKFVGAMPSLDEVLSRFPDHKLLIDIKDRDVQAAKRLAQHLQQLSPEQIENISISGNGANVTYLLAMYPEMEHIYPSKLIKGIKSYALWGWSGHVPEELHNMHVRLPLKYARWMWGWPDRFLQRLESVNARLVIVDGDGVWSDGIDTLEQFEDLPEGFTGTVWTERIDVINPSLVSRD